MSIATVHYLSMNVQKGAGASDGTVTHNTVETFTFTGLSALQDYTIVWGDATANTAMTADAAGAGTKTHNYVAAGPFTLNIYNGTATSGHPVITLAVTSV